MSEYAHQCHFCGEWVRDGYETSSGERHFLSDCRPDLVEHEIGELCTWWNPGSDRPREYTCYAYQDRQTLEWGGEHKHFYTKD